MYFAENGYDPDFGARPLKRLIEEKLIDEIAMQIIENKIKPGDTIEPKLKDGKIVV
jgi:ATP-dependent Clp protease ATP-binding subunit ClpA